MWHLHELLWYLHESLNLEITRTIHTELQTALDETEQLTLLNPEALIKVDVSAHRAKINMLLLQVSEIVRTDARRKLKNPRRISVEVPTLWEQSSKELILEVPT